MVRAKSVTPKNVLVKHPCGTCGLSTRHLILSKFSTDYDGHYNGEFSYETLKCQGCETLSFRTRDIDYEGAYPIDEDEWFVPETIVAYPKILDGHTELLSTFGLPEIVEKIYNQTVQAMKERANILAGIGIRATIESICNDRDVRGQNLEKRIDGLVKAGWISQRDSERLHALRFLGNDAAHDIKEPKSENLIIALQIIEHLLRTIYLLDADAGKLDTVIKTPEQFVTFLNEKLKNNQVNGISPGDEVPLARIFGKDMRRFMGSFSDLQTVLIEKITAGMYTELKIGKMDTFGKSTDMLQHFVVQ